MNIKGIYTKEIQNSFIQNSTLILPLPTKKAHAARNDINH